MKQNCAQAVNVGRGSNIAGCAFGLLGRDVAGCSEGRERSSEIAAFHRAILPDRSRSPSARRFHRAECFPAEDRDGESRAHGRKRSARATFAINRTHSRGVGAKRWMRRAQTSARRVFHAEKRQAILAFADLVNRKNVWMIEAGGCFRFALEAHEHLV